MSLDADAFGKTLEERAAENRRAFEGRYRAEIMELLGLSRDEIELLRPGVASVAAYDQLLTVVKQASAANISEAELRDRILALGDAAVGIAGHVKGLVRILY